MTIDPKGKGGGYFDRAFNRWLPVTQNAVSSDGAHYAYVDMNQSQLHMVDVVGGKERTFSLSAIGANDVFNYGAEGIYMTFGFEGLHGLWLGPPRSRSDEAASAFVSAAARAGGGGSDV